ncbi:MAG TPA: hypothetical protein VMF66_12100 [Candidatus Acidoferrum sp.]|nr:hypothetical protein [Candidatus Acidoferrum sp.]
MKSRLLMVLLFGMSLAASPSFCQTSIPQGTVLPVALNSSLSSNIRPGAKVNGRVMQKVPLPNGEAIPRGAKVIGHVVAATPASDGTPGRLTIRFDRVVTSKHDVRVTTDLRAIAGFVAVSDAQIPAIGPDRGTPQPDWTTEQIGGDIVYRDGNGLVTERARTIGRPVYDGVLVRSNGTQCRAAIDGNNSRQALWVFSADACGVYGLSGVSIVHAGRSNPAGEFTLAAKKGKLSVHSGAGMLLRVTGTGSSGEAARG